MTLSEQVILLSVGSALTAVGWILQALIAGRREDRRRGHERLFELHRDMTSALAMVRAVVEDAHPDRVALNAHPDHSPRMIGDLREQWQPARLALFAASDRHPDGDTRELTKALTGLVRNLLMSDARVAAAVVTGHDLDEPMRRAEKDYQETLDLADILAARIRFFGRGA